jgi:hypothetical protein
MATRIGQLRVWIVLTVLALPASGCAGVLRWLDGVEELGAGYVFEGLDSIVFIRTEHYAGVGTVAVPPKVLAYDYDEKFVVVLSKQPCSGAVVHWLILKSQPSTQQTLVEGGKYPSGPGWANACVPMSYYKFSNVLGPMTEEEFREARKRYDVPAELTPEE